MEIARCMKCKTNKLFDKEPSYRLTKTGKTGILEGQCQVCKTKMCKIIKKR